jgi:hypothetical protein
MKLLKPPPPPPVSCRRPSDVAVTPALRLNGVRHNGVYPMPMVDHLPAWVDTLIRAEYPTNVLVLDFEAYFDADVSMRKLSTVEYIMHPEGEILGASSLLMTPENGVENRYEPFTFWRNTADGGLDRFLSSMDWDNVTVVTQNAAYDMSVLAHKYGIYPPWHTDLLGLARAWHTRIRNRLEDLTRRWGLPDKGDTEEFRECTFRRRWKPSRLYRGKRRPPAYVHPMTPETHAKLAAYANNDVMREWELFTLLAPRLSNPWLEMRAIQHTIELFTKPTLRVDYDAAPLLIEKMEAEMIAALDAASEQTGTEITQKFVGSMKFEDLLGETIEAAGDDPTKYQKSAKNKKGWKYAIASEDPERELLELHEDPTVRVLMAAKSAVQSWPGHIKRIRSIVNQAKATGDRLCVPLRYHGGHTGRWSGGEGLNLQNLGSRGHELINATRGLIMAPPGMELVIADASQIEARGAAWAAGQEDLLAKFRNREEIYCGFASKVLGRVIHKPDDSMDPETYAYMKWARNSVGKVGVLGCGYGMGWEKAVTYAGGEITDDIAKRLVDAYRAENDRITKFWSDIERAFAYTAKHGRPCRLPRGFQFYTYPGCDVVIQLPNGRELKYHKVKVSPGKWGKDSLWVYNDLKRTWGHVWGGHFTENVIQALCRDILWEAVLKMEDAGYHVVHHVHDELIAAVPEGEGEAALAAAIDILSTTPDWAEGLPLAAEGVVTNRYGDH